MKQKTNKNQNLEEAQKLLPWYATGWLAPKERSFVQDMLSKYPALQKELELEHLIIKELKENESLLDLSLLESTEKRLGKVLDKLEPHEVSVQTPIGSVSMSDKLKQFVYKMFSGDSTKLQYAGFAAVSVLSVALLYAFISPLVNNQNTFYPATSASFETAGEDETILLVGLNADSNDPRLKQLLQGVDARINVVPGKDGMYRIHLSKKLSAIEIKSLIQKLTSDKELVWFAGEAY